MVNKFLHQDSEFKTLIQITADELGLNPYMVEKDYWIMHCLWGLQNQNFNFELKGGTSLSKGYKVIHRFSEDIDLRIDPPVGMKVMTGKNHMKQSHLDSRKEFFNWLASEIKIHGIKSTREQEFDDEKFRNAGINLSFKAQFAEIKGIKPVVLLETGFDDTSPNKPITISSWVFDKAFSSKNFDYIDNRAKGVKCYIPEFTFVEKLQALATKHRKFKEGKIEKNFMRHYYDVYCLLDLKEVQSFIGSADYVKRKKERFPLKDEPDRLNQNPAFLKQTDADFALLEANYTATSNLYYKGQPTLREIFERIAIFSNKF
jgi:predicted nucleotidyltransferase component of viral defense system